MDQFFDRLEKPRSVEGLIDYLLENCKGSR